MNNYSSRDRLNLLAEMLRATKNTLEKTRDLYSKGKCTTEQLKTAVASTQLIVNATEIAGHQHSQITERRLF